MASHKLTVIALDIGPQGFAPLTRAELEVLRWLRMGRSNRDIALILSKSEFTVKTQVQQMLAKTGLDNRVQLAVLSMNDLEGEGLPPELP